MTAFFVGFRRMTQSTQKPFSGSPAQGERSFASRFHHTRRRHNKLKPAQTIKKSSTTLISFSWNDVWMCNRKDEFVTEGGKSAARDSDPCLLFLPDLLRHLLPGWRVVVIFDRNWWMRPQILPRVSCRILPRRYSVQRNSNLLSCPLFKQARRTTSSRRATAEFFFSLLWFNPASHARGGCGRKLHSAASGISKIDECLAKV